MKTVLQRRSHARSSPGDRSSAMFLGKRHIWLGMLVWLACSDDPTAPNEEPTDAPPTSATESISPAGGSVEIRTSDDVAVTLHFPPRSLRVAEDITLTALTPEGDSWLQVAVSPAGLALDEPVHITVAAPASVSLDELTSLYVASAAQRFFVPTEVDVDARTLTAELATLGMSDATSGGGRSRTRQAAEAATIGASQAVCAVRLAAAQSALTLLLAESTYERALTYYAAYTALADAVGCGVDLDAFVATATGVVCDAYTGARDAANFVLVDDFDTLYAIVGPLLYWYGEAQLMAADCADATELQSLVEQEFEEFLLFYDPQLQDVDPDDIEQFGKLREEAQDVYRLYVEALQLGLSSQASTLKTERFDPLLRAVRKVAYARCRSHNDHYFLTKTTWPGFWSPQDVLPVSLASSPPTLLDAAARTRLGADPGIPFSDAEIFADIQLCATSVQLRSLDATWNTIASIDLGGGDQPGEATTQGSLTIHADGRLVLDGKLRRLVCFPPGTNAGDELRLTIDGATAATVPNVANPDLLFADVFLEWATLFETAGISNVEPGESYTLRIDRHRTACSDELFGTSPHALFEVTLTVQADAQPDAIEIALVDWTESTALDVVPLAFLARYTLDGKTTGAAVGAQVSIAVTGGSASPSSGTIAADGLFETEVAFAPSVTTLEAAITVSDGSLSATQTVASVQQVGTVMAGLNQSHVSATANDPGGDCAEAGFWNAEPDFLESFDVSKSAGCSKGSGSARQRLDLVVDAASGTLTGMTGSGISSLTGSHASAFAQCEFYVDVVAQPVTMHVTGTLTPALGTNDDQMSFIVRRGSSGSDFVNILHPTGTVEVDETETLSPGRYMFRTYIRPRTSGAGGTIDFHVTFTP